MKLKRVFHHFSKLEEYKSNMWKQCKTNEREGFIHAARQLMIDVDLFESAMMRVVNEWPLSCEANLTASSINHQAWIGHAGCAIAVNSPDDMTRLAWRSLSQEQQDLANAAADRCILFWRNNYKQGCKNAKA